MKSAQIIPKAGIYTLLIIVIGFLPLWIKIVKASFDLTKVFSIKGLLSDGTILYVCLTTTISICAEYLLFKMGKYLFLRELRLVLLLPIFIIIWTCVILFLVESIDIENLNVDQVLRHTLVVCLATLIYVFQMVINNNRVS